MGARVAIVGGGISGLATAYYLEKRASQGEFDAIDLFESSDRLGGKIFTSCQDDLILEMGAESFLERKPWGIQLCRELGIESRLQSTRPETRKTFIWQNGQLHRLPEGLSGFIPANLASLKKTKLLGLFGKIRIAADLILPAKKSDEDESVARFISRRIGRQAYQRIAEPLLCGIYCADGNQLSLQATFPQLRKLEKEHGSLIKGLRAQKAKSSDSDSKKSPFITFDSGMSTLIEAVSSQLEMTNVYRDTKVGNVDHVDRKWVLTGQTKDTVPSDRYDAVVITTPSYVTAGLLPGLDPTIGESLLKIPHATTATVNLWFDDRLQHSLDGYGFVIPSAQQKTMTAATWTSSKHYGRAPESVKLIRAYLGKSGNEIDPEQSDQQLADIAIAELARTMGIQASPVGFRVHRWVKGSPQYTMQHPSLLSQIANSLQPYDGLYVTGASYRGVGIPDCIRVAEETAKSIISRT